MRRRIQMAVIAMALAVLAAAQEVPAAKPEIRPLSYYKLEFVLHELKDTKVINSRSYLMTLENGAEGQIQTGAKVPVNFGAENKNMSYLDVGLNIRVFRLLAKQDYVSLNMSAEINSFVAPEPSAGTGAPPVMRNVRASMTAVVPVNKPTVISTIDDVNSTKRYEIAVTATKMK